MVYGPAAAILQIAHPKVAHGVARHSNFKSDALGRLTRTLADVNSIAFGTRAEAEETKKRLFAMHSKVRGTSESGVDYHALDQDLLIWVLATLVMASVEGHELVYGPIDLAHSLAEQPYGGDIDIHPRLRPLALLRTLSNISHKELLQHIAEGERATWPLLMRVRDQTCVSRALDAAIRRLSLADAQ